MKYQVWATAKNGEGHVMSLGIYEDITEFEMRTEFFTNDLVITIEETEE